MALFTLDALFGGKLTIRQEQEGYRFSLDAVLLAGLSHVRPSDRVVELGAGCGVVLLILAYRRQGQSLTGLELQPELARLARENAAANGFEDRVRILEADFRQVADKLPAESADLVLSNPPYRRQSSGRINSNRQRALARHELAGSLEDVFRAARVLLGTGGRLEVIYPAVRLAHLMVTAHRFGFSPKELTVIHSNPSGTGRLAHLECRKGGGEELRIAPPFFIYRDDGTYSDAMQQHYVG